MIHSIKLLVVVPTIAFALLIAGCEANTGTEGSLPGQCSDGADNDSDGDYDCNDSDCAGAPDCQTDSADTSDASDSSDASDASDSSDASDASDTTDETDSADASDLSDPTDTSDASDATDTTDPADVTDTEVPFTDVDEDGVSVEQGDCDDSDDRRFPGNPEICDGVDNNCDNIIPLEETTDADSDGFVACNDCNDYSSTSYPGALEFCDGLDNNCDFFIDADEQDSDSDGFRGCEGDCNDNNSAINPNAIEVCDELDNNCNFYIDEGLTQTYWLDSDNDTFGGSLSSVSGCSAPPGYVSQGGDCDDDDGSRFPGATELCDGLDNDCDGIVPSSEVDQDNDNVWTCQGDCQPDDGTVYPDAPELCDGKDNDCDTIIPADEADGDNDNWRICQGDCVDTDGTIFPNAVELCDGLDNDCFEGVPVDEIDGDSDGLSSCQGDCDDTNADLNQLDADNDNYSTCDNDCDDTKNFIHPNAAEVCDGFDNNCDQFTPPAELVDADTDGFLACNDCDDSSDIRYPGAPETCNRLDDDCDGVIPDDEIDHDNDFTTECEGDCDDSTPVLNTFDLDQDGFTTCQNDCLDTDSRAFPGAQEVCDDLDTNCNGIEDDNPAYLFGGGTCDLLPAAIQISTSSLTDSWFGASYSYDGDIDGDGLNDLAIGNPVNSISGSGAVYIFLGSTISQGTSLTTTDADIVIFGEGEASKLGTVDFIDDLDGDGLDDLVIGARDADTSLPDAGTVYIVTASQVPASGVLSITAIDNRILGTQANEGFGNSVQSINDLDGDGLNELLIGNGKILHGGPTNYLFMSNTYWQEDEILLSSADVVFSGLWDWEYYRPSIIELGDLDQDGLPDLAFGIYGGSTGDRRSGVFLGSTLVTTNSLSRSQSDYQLNYSHARIGQIGDIDDDGITEVIGMWGSRSFIFSGSELLEQGDLSYTDAYREIVLPEESNFVTSLGDLDGDGVDDLVMLGENQLSIFTNLQNATDGAIEQWAAQVHLNLPTSSSLSEWLTRGGDIDGDDVNDIVFATREFPYNDYVVYIIPSHRYSTL